MALFQSTPLSNFMQTSQNGSQGIPLSATVSQAHSCSISQLIAFPTSLAALKDGITWNASCWVANQRIDEFEQAQICQHAFRHATRQPHIEWCNFASDLSGKVQLLIVFPELKQGFRTQDVMQKWTDGVVLPAMKQLGIQASALFQDFNVIKMAADAEREQTLNVNAPDTPLTQVLSSSAGMTSEVMHQLWLLIQEAANSSSYWGFQNLFLVATCRQPRNSAPQPIEEAWRSIASVWDQAVDMTFVPVESVKANASVTIGAQHIGGGHGSAINGNGNVPSYQPSGDSLWESSRKRKAGDEMDPEKRAKAGDIAARPILPGRLSSTTAAAMGVVPDQDQDMAMG